MSRGVRCGIVSIPASRSIATDAITPLMRARARGLSLTSTKCALPDSRSARPPRSAPRCCRRAAGRAAPRRRTPAREHPLRARVSLRRRVRTHRRARARGRRAARAGARFSSIAARIASICAGVVPQQPPMIAGAERARLRRELGEVVGRRVREDDARCRRGSRGRRSGARRATSPSRCIAASAFSAAAGPALWFAPAAATSSSASRSAAVSAETPPSVWPSRVEGHQRDDRERRDAADGLDRGDELVEVEERLEHEQVDAAALEDLRLLAEELALLGRVEPLDVADRADRAGDEDVAPDTSRASRASRTADELIRSNSSSRKCSRELAPVGAERVRLDQLGAGADEARRAAATTLSGRAGSPPRGSAGAARRREISAPMPPSATIGGPSAGVPRSGSTSPKRSQAGREAVLQGCA